MNICKDYLSDVAVNQSAEEFFWPCIFNETESAISTDLGDLLKENLNLSVRSR